MKLYNKKRIGFRPKPELIPAIDRLMRHNATTIDCKLARELGKLKEVRYLRKDLKKLYIAPDHNMNKSILYLKPDVTIEKDKNLFYFIL